MIELVICNNDGMAEGAYRSSCCKRLQYRRRGSKSYSGIRCRCYRFCKSLIADGKMTGTIMQDAQGMADCISDLVAKRRFRTRML